MLTATCFLHSNNHGAIKKTIILEKETKLKPGKTSIIFNFATYFARTSRGDVTKVKTNWPFLRSPACLNLLKPESCHRNGMCQGREVLKYGSNATTIHT